MSPNLFGGCENDGVRESMHWLGLMYQEGVGVAKSDAMAFKWYQRAADLEHGPSACNLGNMYMTGRGGIPCANPERAVQYWQLAVRRKCTIAMLALSEYYLRKGQVEEARRFFKWAVEAGDLRAIAGQADFEEACQQKADEVLTLKAQLENKLGVSFQESKSVQESVQAHLAQSAPDVARMMKDLDLALRKSATGASPASHALGYKYEREVIAKYAVAGRPFAQQVLKASEHMYRATNSLISYVQTRREGDRDTFVEELGQCLELASFVAICVGKEFLMEFLQSMIKRYEDECCQLDIYARECYAFILMESYEEIAAFLRRCIAKYPQVPFFYNFLVAAHGFQTQFKVGLSVAEKALTLFPNHCDILFDKAGMSRLALLDGDPRRLIPNHLKFLEHAPVDHRQAPGEYYTIALLLLEKQPSQADFEQASMYYEQGLKREEVLMPCFLPYVLSPAKMMVKTVLDVWRLEETGRLPLQRPVSRVPPEDKLPRTRLACPLRKAAILSHRNTVNVERKAKGSNFVLTHQPLLEQSAPLSIAGLKAVTLAEMNPTEDKVYKGCVLDVVVIEDPSPIYTPCVTLLLEDKQGQVLPGYFYNVNDDARVKYGASISVVNPYLRIGFVDKKPGIRVDDPKSLFFHPENGASRCRYCGELDTKFYCAKCGKAYCSKECQKLDWKVMKHKLICA